MNRKFFLLVLSCLFMPLLMWAQSLPAIVHGTVTNATSGAPVSGATVYIWTDSSGFFMYYNSRLTDANGAYADTIISPPNGIGIYAAAVDCNGSLTTTQNFTYALGTTNNFTANFSICSNGGGGGSCLASYTYQVNPNGLVSFTSTSVASNPNTPLTYNWTIMNLSTGATAATSTLANPSVSLATGTYNVCLAIADNSGCIDSICQNLTIGGGTGGNCDAQFSWVANGLTVQFDGSNSVGTNYNWVIANSMSTAQSPSYTFSQAGTYTVCLTVSDTIGCSDSICQVVTVSGGGGTLFNTLTVTASAAAPGTFAPDTFMVYIIQYDSIAGTLTAVDSATAVQGPNGGLASCTFSNLTGDYLVKAAVSTVNSPNYATSVPTYYANSLFWATGNYVSLPSASAMTININMIQGVNPGGPGFVGGLVSQGANKTGIPNIEIMLLDMNDNPIQYTYTNGSGSFNFSNVAYGTYKVYAEVIGKPTTPAIVTISASTPSAGDVAIEINSTYVSTAVNAGVFFDNNVKLYPNPTADMTTLAVELKQNANVVVEITNIFGQLVEKKESKFLAGENQVKISTNNWQSGVYFVKVIANGVESEVQKLIIK